MSVLIRGVIIALSEILEILSTGRVQLAREKITALLLALEIQNNGK